MNNQNASRSKHRTPGRLSLIGCAAIGLLVMGGAQAQWQVIDRQLVRDSKSQWDGENKQRDDTNERLDNMQKIGEYESAGDVADEPEEKLDAESPSASVNLGIEERCPTPSAPGVVQQQWQLCQEIVKTEMAQYKYSLKMYETTKQRHERLKAIENQRSALDGAGGDEQGKLQDNTNKLLALMSLMEIDRQQNKTYMDAYEARLRYLVTARDLLTQQALEGKAGANPIAGLIGAGVLRAALEGAKTDRRYSP